MKNSRPSYVLAGLKKQQKTLQFPTCNTAVFPAGGGGVSGGGRMCTVATVPARKGAANGSTVPHTAPPLAPAGNGKTRKCFTVRTGNCIYNVDFAAVNFQFVCFTFVNFFHVYCFGTQPWCCGWIIDLG